MNNGKVCGVALALLFAMGASAQVITSRRSQMNYNYVFGGGGDSYTGNDSDDDNALLPTAGQHLQYDQGYSGVLPNGQPWAAGTACNLLNDYLITGPLNDFTKIEVAGQSRCVAYSSGAGLAAMYANNVGNQVQFQFTLPRPRIYSFDAAVTVTDGTYPGEVYLQRFNGFNWEYVATTLFLPSGIGTISTTGTLLAGPYRVIGGVSISAQGNQDRTASYNFTYQNLPNNVTISGTCALGDFIGNIAGETVDFEIRTFNNTLLDTVQDVPLNASGGYSFTTAITGTFLRISARGRTWLRRTVSDLALVQNQSTTANFAMPNGDADQSGEVDAVDIDEVIAHFGEVASDPGFHPNSDLDGSLEVDAVDIDVAIANFGAVDE